MSDWDQDPELAKVPPGLPDAPPDPRCAVQIETAFLNLCEALGLQATPLAYLDAAAARAALNVAQASPVRQKLDHPSRPDEADYEYDDLKRRIEKMGGPGVVVGILQQYAFAAPRQGSYAGSLWAISEWLNEQLASPVPSANGGAGA